MRLLPTPTTQNAGGNRWNNRGEALLPGIVMGLDGRWISLDGDDYGPAIRRWEGILGREAPAPTERTRGEGRGLSARFVEWMQGDDDGWITSVDIPRNKQIKIAGNQAITRQAVEGYRRLLTADLEAMAA